MPLGLWNIQWLNQNSQRAYPMVDWGSKKDKTETIRLPDSFIVAMDFPVHQAYEVDPDKFYIQSIGIYPTGYHISIGYDDGSATPPMVGTVNITKATHTENLTYAIAGTGNFDDSVGHVAVGKLDEMDLLPTGVYTFLPAATTLEADCIWPICRGIMSLTAVTGTDRSARLYGDIELVAGDNMRIAVNMVEGQIPQIVFSAVRGEGLNETCVCEEEGTGPCIRFINGIPPLPDGNFRMVGDKCITLDPITNGLQLKDKCSSPCCGCEELDALTRQIDLFADGVLTMKNFSSRLNAEVTNMSQVVLGSRLADQGCLECGS